MRSNRESHVLRTLHGHMIYQACITKLAADLPPEVDTKASEGPGSYAHGAGKCSLCGQFSPLILFTPREHTKQTTKAK